MWGWENKTEICMENLEESCARAWFLSVRNISSTNTHTHTTATSIPKRYFRFLVFNFSNKTWWVCCVSIATEWYVLCQSSIWCVLFGFFLSLIFQFDRACAWFSVARETKTNIPISTLTTHTHTRPPHKTPYQADMCVTNSVSVCVSMRGFETNFWNVVFCRYFASCLRRTFSFRTFLSVSIVVFGMCVSDLCVVCAGAHSLSSFFFVLFLLPSNTLCVSAFQKTKSYSNLELELDVVCSATRKIKDTIFFSETKDSSWCHHIQTLPASFILLDKTSYYT